MSLAIAILAVVTAERAGELVLAARNTRRLRAQGAREIGAAHYPILVVLHAAWLAGLWVFARNRGVELGWLVAFATLQAGRIWVLATLRGRWTTRILVLPGAPLIREGPYRFIAHPNYLVVAGETAVLPLTLGLPVYAAVFSALNAAALWIRIRAENRALRDAL
ncbi:MAG: isoprenylcysteine carboxyl methyltransferase family protein [Caulobacteraceae bacterium]